MSEIGHVNNFYTENRCFCFFELMMNKIKCHLTLQQNFRCPLNDQSFFTIQDCKSIFKLSAVVHSNVSVSTTIGCKSIHQIKGNSIKSIIWTFHTNHNTDFTFCDIASKNKQTKKNTYHNIHLNVKKKVLLLITMIYRNAQHFTENFCADI